MDVFISWSGERSRAAAEALRDWLPMIINATKPFLSANDIQKGTRWASELALKLQTAKAGIICLTPGNIHSDWLLFETGALSKTLEQTYVCPFLIGLEPSDVKGPLAQFQATKSTKSEVLKLIKTLNSALGDSALGTEHIEKAFEVWWPKLDTQLQNLPSEEAKSHPQRSERDLLEEILGLVRNQDRSAEPAISEWVPPDELPLVSTIERGINNVVGSTGDKVTALSVINVSVDGTGRRWVGYWIKPAKKHIYQIVLPLPVSTIDLVEVIKDQIQSPVKSSDEHAPS